MNSGLLALAACASVLASPDGGSDVGRAGHGKAGQSVVARVNGEPVSSAEFRRMLANPVTRSELERETGSKDPDVRQLERLALQKVIHHRLLLQEAGRRNIEITRQDLDQAVGALRRGFDDLESFGRWMTEQGLDDKGLYEAIRGDMMAGRVWASLVEGVRVTDEQAQEYYAAHRDELVRGEEVQLRIIAVADKGVADELLVSLKRGASFEKLARQRSEGLRAAQGGATGWVDARQLPEPLARAVPQLKPGDVAGPLDNGSGEFLLVGLEARRPIPAKTMPEARPEIERRLLPVNQKAAVMAWLTQQERQSQIEVFYSSEVK